MTYMHRKEINALKIEMLFNFFGVCVITKVFLSQGEVRDLLALQINSQKKKKKDSGKKS